MASIVKSRKLKPGSADNPDTGHRKLQRDVAVRIKRAEGERGERERIDSWINEIKECPTMRPSAIEFEDPMKYISSLAGTIGAKYGKFFFKAADVCKVVRLADNVNVASSCTLKSLYPF